MTGDHPNQTREPAPINEEKNSENKEGQFEAENNEGNLSPSEVNNVQIENAGEENSAKTVKSSRLKLILPLYLIGLISLSIAALGFCFAPFTNYAYVQYKFVSIHNFQWVWVCAIIAGIIFLADLIAVLILKNTKQVGSLKKILQAKFSIPLAASIIICIIVGLVGGTSYYNRLKTDYQADISYINKALQQEEGNSSSSTSNSSASSSANSSLFPSQGASDAAVAITLGATCTEYETESEISNDDLEFNNNPEDGGPFIIASENTAWDPMMTCIAQKLDMPTSVETKLKAVITQSVSALQSSSSDLQLFSNLQSLNTSWNLKDGSTIYLSFGPPAISIGYWAASFGVTNSDASTTSPSNSSENLNSNNEPGNQSSSNMSSATNNSNNAIAAINSTATCTEYETESEISAGYLDVESNPEDGGPGVNVAGDTGKWGPVLTCVAQKLQIPTMVKIELKVQIAQSSAAAAKGQNSNSGGINTSWNLSNGGKIYLSFMPADLMQGWDASFSLTNQQ